MKKWHDAVSKGALITGFIALSSYGFADECGFCGWGVESSIEYLYFKPYVDDLDFVLKSKDGIINHKEKIIDGNGRFGFINLDWESGVRASLLKRDLLCCINLGASYMYLHAADSKSKRVDTPQQMFATLTHGGFEIPCINFAKGEWDLNFQTGDIWLSMDFCCCDGHLFTPRIGATALVIEQEIKARYDSLSGDIALFDWDSRYTAFGLKFGLDYNFCLTENLDIYARAYGSLVTGDVKDVNKNDRCLNTSDYKKHTHLKLKSDECLFVPGWHLAIGVMYHECLCGFDVGLRIGYEFMAWHGINNPARFVDDGVRIGTGSSRSSTTFGLQGVTAGLEMNF